VRTATSSAARGRATPRQRHAAGASPALLGRARAGLAAHVGEKLIANLATLTIHSGFGSIGNAPVRVTGAGGREGRRLIGGRATDALKRAASICPPSQSAARVSLSPPPPPPPQVPREFWPAGRPHFVQRRLAAIVDYGQKLNFVASVNELTPRTHTQQSDAREQQSDGDDVRQRENKITAAMSCSRSFIFTCTASTHLPSSALRYKFNAAVSLQTQSNQSK